MALIADREDRFAWRLAATRADAIQVARLFRDVFLAKQERAPVDPELAMADIWTAVQGGTCAMILHDGELIGAMMATPVRYWWSRAQFLEAQTTAVIEKYRGSGAARKIFAAARFMAEVNAMPVQLSIPSERQSRFGTIHDVYEFTPIGVSLVVEAA